MAESITIAAFGDSLTAGYGLEQGEGLVAQLQAWLDVQGVEAHLINAGVSGDTSGAGLGRLGWMLSDDIDAVIVAFGGNDYLRGLDPSVMRANLSAMLEHLSEVEVLLVGIPAGANYGPDYQAEFNAIYTDLGAQYDVPVYPNIFAGIQEAADRSTSLQHYFQDDALHPNKDGVALIVEALGPEVAALIATLK